MPLTRLSVFETYLTNNSIPIDGLSAIQPHGPDTVTIHYQVSATVEQIAWAEQAKQTFDWRPRRFLNKQVIASTYAGLTAQQKTAVLNRLIALLIVNNEAEVLQMFSDLGASFPYDEVAP